ncbi:Predicted alpha-1,6-mannanase, GH76 family [Paenibacillus catalpae]|uniref:Predicted alpha-1,6-mannanase, GH76 family n=1 Tax=Paenibacillus catalpae TaxID=1045775 RepID=A0A1I2E8I5_9BACL|nr:carbohydrate-binding protein [Paenibacillus catalpae]SFE89017.1 Predicted alpha-1,6-mannanase, GH76 family [Paenibacillus catalpae]
MSSKTRRRSKLIVLPVVLALSISPLFPNGIPRAHAFEAADAKTAIEAYNDAFWDASAKYFWKTSNHDGYQDFWVEAELWELVMDAYLEATDPALKAELRTQIDDVFDGAVAKYGQDWTNNTFNDDIMWWAMASARAYQITNDAKYLERAEYYFNYVYDTQWDDEFAGGGIWWKSDDRTTKNACINFPAAEAAVFLYNVTNNERYLDAASKIYRWSKTMLTDGNGKVFDRIETQNGPIQGATHYNQGTFIGAAVGLYQVTGDMTYLDDALEGATFTREQLVDANGLLRYEGPNGDLKGGKTILVRNLGYLQKVVNASKESKYKTFAESYNEWLAFNTDMAWSHRNAANLVDSNWAGQQLSGTFESWSSAAAVQALTSLEPQDAEQLEYAVKSPYNKLEAESFNIVNGPGLEGSIEGSLQLGGIQDGNYAAYKNVDFGSGDGASGFIARASSGTGGGQIEVRLDALDGPKVGTLNVEGTGGWNNFIDAVTLLKDDQGQTSHVTGVHDVYLVFKKTNDSYLFNLNWFKFTKTDPTKTDAYAKLQAENYASSDGLSMDSTGQFADGIHNNAYASYEDIDFGSGAAGVTVHVASGNKGGSIEVKLDGLDGPTAGVIEIPAFGSWNEWVDVTSIIDDSLAVGTHDVYLIFHGADGSDYPCNLDWFTFSTIKGKARDAFSKLEAENFTNSVSVGTENGGNQTYLAGVYGPNKPYAMYNYIDFGDVSPTQFHVQAASDTSGGIIEARIDGINGPVIATAEVSGTGGWQTFQVFDGEMTAPVTGKHLVYLLFKGNDWLYNFDKFTFGDPSVFTAPTLPPDPVDDEIPPGEVENVHYTRDNSELTVHWDGPYAIDGDVVHLKLQRNGQQVGEVVEVKRGIQKAVLTGIEADLDYTLVISAADKSGNESAGVTIAIPAVPVYSLTANGSKLAEGAVLEDDAILRFQAGDSKTAIRSASLTFDGKVYEGAKLNIALAGHLGEKTVVIAVEDAAGNKLQKTIHIQVKTSIRSMSNLVDLYKASNDVSKSLAAQLVASLKQAQQHLDKGKRDQAIKHMQDFIKQLNKANKNSVTDQAKAILNNDAEALIASWKKK